MSLQQVQSKALDAKRLIDIYSQLCARQAEIQSSIILIEQTDRLEKLTLQHTQSKGSSLQNGNQDQLNKCLIGLMSVKRTIQDIVYDDNVISYILKEDPYQIKIAYSIESKSLLSLVLNKGEQNWTVDSRQRDRLDDEHLKLLLAEDQLMSKLIREFLRAKKFEF